MRVNLIPILFFILSAQSILAATSSEYISEFNNVNERCSIHGSWRYLDNASRDSLVTNYRCCSDTCIDIPYDLTHNDILQGNNLGDVSKLVVLYDKMQAGNITENQYEVEQLPEGTVCEYYGLDVFKKQTENAAYKLSAEQVAPEVLSKKDANLVKELYEGLVKIKPSLKVDAPELIISAVCTGGSAVETAAISSITSCKTYVIAAQSGYAYYGMVDQLGNCRARAISNLNLAKYSPNNFVRFVDQKVKSFFSMNCISKAFQNCDSEESVYQYYQRKLDALTLDGFSEVNSEYSKVARAANQRFIDKKNATGNQYSELMVHLDLVEAKLSDADHFWNFIYEPSHNFSMVKIQIKAAKENATLASELLSQNKFNSASEVMRHTSIALPQIEKDIDSEMGVKRKVSIFWIALLLVIVVIVIFGAIWNSRRRDDLW